LSDDANISLLIVIKFHQNVNPEKTEKTSAWQEVKMLDGFFIFIFSIFYAIITI